MSIATGTFSLYTINDKHQETKDARRLLSGSMYGSIYVSGNKGNSWDNVSIIKMRLIVQFPGKLGEPLIQHCAYR